MVRTVRNKDREASVAANNGDCYSLGVNGMEYSWKMLKQIIHNYEDMIRTRRRLFHILICKIRKKLINKKKLPQVSKPASWARILAHSNPLAV
jgi:hypothetical protein